MDKRHKAAGNPPNLHFQLVNAHPYIMNGNLKLSKHQIFTYPRHTRPSILARASHLVIIGNLVPKFTRIGEPIREWLSHGLAEGGQTEGSFNGNNINQLLTPDLINQADVSSVVLFLLLLLSFYYLEGNELLAEIFDDKELESFQDEQKDPKRNNYDTKTKLEAERRQGLGWLALATAVAVWTSGSLVKILPGSE
jgi:hypothetical protein